MAPDAPRRHPTGERRGLDEINLGFGVVRGVKNPHAIADGFEMRRVLLKLHVEAVD